MSATIVSLNLIVIPEVRNELSGIHVRHTQYNRPETGLVRMDEILRGQSNVCNDSQPQPHRHTRGEERTIRYPCSAHTIQSPRNWPRTSG